VCVLRGRDWVSCTGEMVGASDFFRGSETEQEVEVDLGREMVTDGAEIGFFGRATGFLFGTL